MLGAGGAQRMPAQGTSGPFTVMLSPSHKPGTSSIFQQRNLRHREVERLAWGCTAGRWHTVTDPGAGERDTHSVCLS